MTQEEYSEELAKEGMQEALRQFISSKVYGLQQIDDVLQDTNLKIIEKYDQYDDSGKFQAWAKTVAYWTIREFTKKRAISKIVFDSELMDSLSVVVDNGEVELDYDYLKLKQELNKLVRLYDPERQEIINLLMQGIKSNQVQELTGSDIRLIYQTKQKISKDIKKEFEENKILQEYLK